MGEQSKTLSASDYFATACSSIVCVQAQLVLLAILLLALADFLIGCMIPPSDEQKSKGFVGFSGV